MKPRRKAAGLVLDTFEQAFKNIDDALRKDSGCTSELDYTEQTSWMLFLRYLDDLEKDRYTEAELSGRQYAYILEPEFRWSSWAAPKTPEGLPDHRSQLTGPDLLAFVNDQLFPYLRGFKARAAATTTIEYKIGEIFDEVRNRVASGYTLRDVIEELDRLEFRSQNQKHELSALYEVKIRNMGNAGRNGGEYYTPRPLIRAIVRLIDPQVGETVYDGACGSAGFLCESYEYMTASGGLTTRGMRRLQESTFFGKEKKALPYVTGIMNMILHGIDAPNIQHTNTLMENLNAIKESDRHDVVLANPPFGGSERKEIRQNFPIRCAETAWLFLEHFIKVLKANGRAGVVIKNTFLINRDASSNALRQHLLQTCDLHTVLVLPRGTFQGAGVRTVVLFFQKGRPSKRIWFYELDPGRTLGKSNPLNDDDLKDFITWSRKKRESDRAWFVDVKDLDPETFEMVATHPSRAREVSDLSAHEALYSLDELNVEDQKAHQELEDAWQEAAMLSQDSVMQVAQLQEVAAVEYGTRIVKKNSSGSKYPVYGGGAETFRTDDFNRESRVVISRFGMSEECVRVVAGRFFLNDSGLTLAPLPASGLSQDYLDKWALMNMEEIYSLGRGAAQANLDVQALREMPIEYPDLESQARVVAALDRVDLAIQRLRAIAQTRLALTERLGRTVALAVLSGEDGRPEEGGDSDE